MGTNYVPVRTDLFLYSYELDIILGLLKSRSYKWTIHYIDDVFTLNNSKKGFRVTVTCLYINISLMIM